MALGNTTKIANRFGLNLKFYPYTTDGSIEDEESHVVTIDFANEIAIELSSELTWATGGQAHKNMIPFKDPTEGTMTISTQIITSQILKLAAGNDPAGTDNKASFLNDDTTITPRFYIAKGETVWKGEDGSTYNEEVTVYKAAVVPGYNVTYTGDGDPQSVDIEFQLGTNDAGKILDIERSDVTAGDDDGSEVP